MHIYFYAIIQVEVFVPGVADLPQELCPPLPVYCTAQLTLSQFIQPELCHCIPSQSLAALSVNSRVDTDNVYAVLPSGVYVTVLSQSYLVYQERDTFALV